MSASITGWGIQYERPVSRDTADKLCAARGFHRPRIGYEVTIAAHASTTYVNGSRGALLTRQSFLVLANIAGRFVLASSDRERNEWRTVFGVDPVHPCVPVDNLPSAGIPSDGQNLGRDCDG